MNDVNLRGAVSVPKETVQTAMNQVEDKILQLEELVGALADRLSNLLVPEEPAIQPSANQKTGPSGAQIILRIADSRDRILRMVQKVEDIHARIVV